MVTTLPAPPPQARERPAPAMREADETFVVVRTGPRRVPGRRRGGPWIGGRLGKAVGGAVVVGDDEPIGQEGGQGTHRLLGVASTTGGS